MSRLLTENDFRDALVLQIIKEYGREQREHVTAGRPPASSCRVRHCSQVNCVKRRCHYCKIQGNVRWTQRKCHDCLHSPALCQTAQRDCHSLWHEASFDVIRDLCFQKRSSSQTSSTTETASRGPGRPRGAKKRRKRRGRYRC